MVATLPLCPSPGGPHTPPGHSSLTAIPSTGVAARQRDWKFSLSLKGEERSSFMERATTQEQTMGRNITFQATGEIREIHMPVAASANTLGIRPPYSLWGGMRRGYLTDPHLSPTTSVSYVAYHLGTIPIPVCPVPIAYTWLPWDQSQVVSVPSVWSREAMDIHHQLENQCTDAVASNAFPCSLKAIVHLIT